MSYMCALYNFTLKDNNILRKQAGYSASPGVQYGNNDNKAHAVYNG